MFLEALHKGYEKVVDNLLAEGFSNIRACLKMNNHLEIDNEVALFNVSFFVSHMQQGELGIMKKLYYELVDLM
jgi:hypothetical protein